MTTLNFGEVTGSSGARPSTDKLSSSAIQADGKTVVAGSTNVGDGDLDLAIARFSTDGSLDSTFGEQGWVVTDFGADEQVSAVAVSSNGEIVAIGSSTQDKGVIVLAKYTEDGSLDPSFGEGGRVVTSFGSDPYGEAKGAAVLLQPDGGIVVGGSVAAGYEVVNFALVRHMADGGVDPAFGTDGRVALGIRGWDTIRSLKNGPDGTILAAGTASVPTYSSKFAVARFAADGTLDTTFGMKNVFLDEAPRGAVKRMDSLTGFAVAGDGSLLLSGRSGSPGNQAASSPAMKLTADGTHSTGFPDRVFAFDRAARLALMPADRFVTAGSIHGSSENPTAMAFSLTAYNTDGSRHDNFGNRCRAITGFEGGAEATDLTPASDGQLLATGTSYSGNDDSAIARYEGLGAATAGTGGTETAPPRRSRPELRLTVLGRTIPSTASALLKRGVRVKVRCNRACEARVKLVIPRSTAHRFGLSSRVVAWSTRKAARAQAVWMTTRLKPRMGRSLARSAAGGSLVLSTEIQARPLAGGSRWSSPAATGTPSLLSAVTEP